MTCTAAHEALQQPGIYPDTPAKVEARDTHISWVYLTDHDVYKVKKPLNLGFLDFSTLEQRRFFCERELVLNRRLSTDVYLEVVPIYQSGSHVNFDGDGTVVEYALKMRRLSDDRVIVLRQGVAICGAPHPARRAAYHRSHRYG